MSVTKHTFDLKNLRSDFLNDEQEVIDLFFQNREDVDIINKLIVLAKTELTLYTEEDFNFYGLCKSRLDLFSDFESVTIFDIKKELSTIYLSNFIIRNLANQTRNKPRSKRIVMSRYYTSAFVQNKKSLSEIESIIKSDQSVSSLRRYIEFTPDDIVKFFTI